MNKDQQKIKTLENQLDKLLVKYNDLVSKNKSMRQQIDVERKEQRYVIRSNQP